MLLSAGFVLSAGMEKISKTPAQEAGVWGNITFELQRASAW